MTRYSNDNVVEVLGFVHADPPTKAAILFGQTAVAKEAVWVPRSQITAMEEHRLDSQTKKMVWKVHMKQWLADKNEFDYEEID